MDWDGGGTKEIWCSLYVPPSYRWRRTKTYAEKNGSCLLWITGGQSSRQPLGDCLFCWTGISPAAEDNTCGFQSSDVPRWRQRCCFSCFALSRSFEQETDHKPTCKMVSRVPGINLRTHTCQPARGQPTCQWRLSEQPSRASES